MNNQDTAFHTPSLLCTVVILKYRKMKTIIVCASQMDQIMQNSDQSVFVIKLDTFTSHMKAILAQMTSFPLFGRFIEDNIAEQ